MYPKKKVKAYRIAREFISEFVGTAILIVFGDGVCACVTLTEKGGWLSINFGWGLGVFLGASVAMRHSGGQLNPSVTTTMALLGRLPWWKVPHYIVAQVSGAFFGAALVYGVYKSAFDHYHSYVGTLSDTMGDFSTYPMPHMGILGGFFEQIFLTMLLLIGVLYAADPRHGFHGGVVAAIAGITVLAIGVCLGSQTGYAINPARDFGPRLFTYCAGWGSQVWTAGNHWFWVPMTAPIIGGALGGLVYEVVNGEWGHIFGVVEQKDSNDQLELAGSSFHRATTDGLLVH